MPNWLNRIAGMISGNGRPSPSQPGPAMAAAPDPKSLMKARISALQTGEHARTPTGSILEQLRRDGWEIKPGAMGDASKNVGRAMDHDGSPVVPHILTYTGYSSLGRVYRNPDEAIRHSHVNALYMRNDLATMECVEARQRLVALTPWHLETDNPKSSIEKELCAGMTSILKRIPRWTEYRRSLQEGIWYGRSANQGTFGRTMINGRKCTTLQPSIYGPAWMPINGDKLAFRYGSNQIGIRIGWSLPDSQQSFFDDEGKERQVEITSGYGRCYFLDDEDRERVVLHKHMIEDGDYLDPVAAGSLHGVGIRSRIYWTWYQKHSTLQLLMEYLERSAVGFEVWTYPWGNKAALTETQNAAINRLGFGKNIVFVPRMPNDPDLYSFQHQETGLQGIEMIDNIIHKYFEWQIKRYILGQITSSEPEGAGLGSSGLTDFQADTLANIIKYDAKNSDESITTDLVATLQRKNRHVLPAGTEDVHVRFVSDTEDEEVKEKLEALEKAVGMGLRIKVDDVYETLGYEKPGPDDECIGGQQQTAGVAPGAQSILGTAQPGQSVLDVMRDHIAGQQQKFAMLMDRVEAAIRERATPAQAEAIDIPTVVAKYVAQAIHERNVERNADRDLEPNANAMRYAAKAMESAADVKDLQGMIEKLTDDLREIRQQLAEKAKPTVINIEEGAVKANLASPEITNIVNVPETIVQNTVNVPQTKVINQNTIEVSPTPVEVKVEPTPVTVQAEVKLPDRPERKGQITPDGKGGFVTHFEDAK